MSSRKKGNTASDKSPSPKTAKETGTMSPISNSSPPHTAIESGSISPLSNASSETNMRTVPVGTSRSSIFNCKSSTSQFATSQTANDRLVTSILVFLSMNLCLVVASRLTVWDTVVSRLLASVLSPFIAFFGYQWCCYYSAALTRKKRAFWVEPNILLTYQPRARYSGHLFKPDPPTPRVADSEIAGLPPIEQLAVLQRQEDEVKNAETGTEEELKDIAKRALFTESRKQFYGGEWAAAVKGSQDRASTNPLFAPNESSDKDKSSAASSSVASTNIASSLQSGKLDDQKKKEDEKNAAEKNEANNKK